MDVSRKRERGLWCVIMPLYTDSKEFHPPPLAVALAFVGTNYFQKKNFGIADDIYQMGLLVLFVLFKSASNPETSLDMLTLKRYVEITFSGNIKEEFRDFMKADQEFAATIEWLDEHDGWGLIEAMLHQDWKQRPTADSCLMHPFLKQTLKYK